VLRVCDNRYNCEGQSIREDENWENIIDDELDILLKVEE
jgi:hypothetical protein